MGGHSLLPKPSTPEEFAVQVVGTFSFLLGVGLASQILAVRARNGRWPVKEVLAPLGGFLYPALMFFWAMDPWRFDRPLPWAGTWAAGLLGLALLCAGVSVMGLAMTQLGDAWRMGTDPEQRTLLVADGLYARVRHPIYSGFFALLLGVWVASGGIFFAVVGAVYAAVLLRKARQEERHLLDVFGGAYRDYLARTGRFLPK